MYISIDQIENSIAELGKINPFFGIPFLAFKRRRLPVGRSIELVFSELIDTHLAEYFRPSVIYNGYYHPFKGSNPSKKWMAPRYGSTSAQRVTKDTFGDAFIHKSNTSSWGWKEDYVEVLKRHLGRVKLPAFHMAVWMLRGEEWDEAVSSKLIRDRFLDRFHITEQEARELFDVSVPVDLAPFLQNTPVSEDRLLGLIGHPPGALPFTASTLSRLELVGVGPAERFIYEPGERLNLITGDNSLGKTFVLEALWWSLTGHWLDYPIVPNRRVSKLEPEISFNVERKRQRRVDFRAHFDWSEYSWVLSGKGKEREWTPGLVLYARYDGSFAVWDPARAHRMNTKVRFTESPHVFFHREEVWNGLPAARDSSSWICNGLIRDWVLWQNGGSRYSEQFDALRACLEALSPSDEEKLEVAEPVEMPFDAQECPALRMRYGSIPIKIASAAVKRVLSIAYLLVWAWHTYVANSHMLHRSPQPRLVLIVDEIEAHLHPKWQRVIVPSIVRALGQLSSDVLPQIHIATHSPMVMASVEPLFRAERDRLHHLFFDSREVKIDSIPFVKRGTADSWLLSDAFGLGQARSLPAEKAISEAKTLQMLSQPGVEDIARVDAELRRLLADDDEFWPRWRFFAIKHGVDR